MRKIKTIALLLTMFALATLVMAYKVVQAQTILTPTEYEYILLDTKTANELQIIHMEQDTHFSQNNKYLHVPKYSCPSGTCQIDEYVTPNNEKGYILHEWKTENSVNYHKQTCFGVQANERTTQDWEIIINNDDEILEPKI